MMKLGFVSAILPEQSLDEVFRFAADVGYDCVELMCWPPGKADRRYAGVTHVDVTNFTPNDGIRLAAKAADYRVSISGLGYYPNPLCADAAEAKVYVDHIMAVIHAAAMTGVGVVNTFVGRNHTLSVDENWPRFVETWMPIIKHAEANNVKVAIENCPMSFTRDEWPGGKNLAHSPAVWRRMFGDIPSPNFGLNYDPSHPAWMMMDYVRPIHEFKDRIFHVHAKDIRIDRDKLNDHGILAYPNIIHHPKLPGLGDVNWGDFFAALTDARYRGPVCVEVEDRAYEGSLTDRQTALKQCYNYLRNFIPKV